MSPRNEKMAEGSDGDDSTMGTDETAAAEPHAASKDNHTNDINREPTNKRRRKRPVDRESNTYSHDLFTMQVITWLHCVECN